MNWNRRFELRGALRRHEPPAWVRRASRLGRWRRWWRRLLSARRRAKLVLPRAGGFLLLALSPARRRRVLLWFGLGSGSTAGISEGSATVDCGSTNGSTAAVATSTVSAIGSSRVGSGGCSTFLSAGLSAGQPRRRALLRPIPRGFPRASAFYRRHIVRSRGFIGTSVGDGSVAGNSWTALGGPPGCSPPP